MSRRNRLTAEQAQNLVEMYNSVIKDFEEFPFIKTTEDIFSWREAVKEAHGNDGQSRNEYIEEAIKDNDSLKLLYDWTKFYRMVDRAKAKLYTTKVEHGLEDDKDYQISPAGVLHSHLTQEHKGNTDQLFGIFGITGLNIGIRYNIERTLNTPYEFEKAIVSEDLTAPWPAVLFVTLLKAYEVSGEDLLTVGRKIEKTSNDYVREIEDNYPRINRGIPYTKTQKSFQN